MESKDREREQVINRREQERGWTKEGVRNKESKNEKNGESIRAMKRIKRKRRERKKEYKNEKATEKSERKSILLVNAILKFLNNSENSWIILRRQSTDPDVKIGKFNLSGNVLCSPHLSNAQENPFISQPPPRKIFASQILLAFLSFFFYCFLELNNQ